MTSAPTPRLSAEGLTLSLGERAVLRDASLTLLPGEVAVLEGPSGCGKSTFLRALARLVAPSRGRLALDGVDARSLAPEAWRRRVAYVFQQAPMFDGSVADNLAAGPRLAGRALSPAEVGALAARVGLAATLLAGPATSLSGGERMRAAIARALANEPSVLLLDEPTAALDPESASTVVALVRALSDHGIGVVVVTHSAEHAAALDGTRYRFADGGPHRREEASCAT